MENVLLLSSLENQMCSAFCPRADNAVQECSQEGCLCKTWVLRRALGSLKNRGKCIGFVFPRILWAAKHFNGSELERTIEYAVHIK